MTTTCTPPRPGSVWPYCRCPEHAPIAARIRKLHSAGVVSVTGREKAWKRLWSWHALGYTPKVVRSMTGLGEATVKRLYAGIERGQVVPMQQTTVTAILTSSGIPTGVGRVSAVGSSRRMRALAVMGWSTEALVERTGISTKTIQTLRRGSHPMISAATANAVNEAYEALWDVAGPSTRARQSARALGWAPPLAWDDDTIDDPDAQPYTDRRPAAGVRSAESVVDDVADLLDLDPFITSTEVAHRLGYVDSDPLQKALKRAGRTDLLAQLARNAHHALATGRTA